jgi:hypothetical protein
MQHDGNEGVAMSWKTMTGRTKTAVVAAGAAVLVVVGAGAAVGATGPSTPTSSHHAVASAPSPAHPTHRRTATPTPTPTAVVTTKLVQQIAAIAFPVTTVQDPSRPKGTSAVTTAGVNGVRTTTYRVTYRDGVETGRVELGQVVTTPPVAQVTTVGSYVAPAPAPAPVAPAAPVPAPAPAQAATITPGAYCSASEVGQVAVAANGRSYQCGGHGPDARGSYHWNTTS